MQTFRKSSLWINQEHAPTIRTKTTVNLQNQIITNCLQCSSHKSVKHFNWQIAVFNFNSLGMFSKQTQTTTGLKKAYTELYVQYSTKQISLKPHKLPINKDLWTVKILPPGIRPHQNLNFCIRRYSIWSVKASVILWGLTLTPQSKALPQRWHLPVWLSAVWKSINHTHHNGIL